MSEEHAIGSDTFEPPKYLASLIGAVNDGAKAAQAAALVFALVGVYLLATAFSASDEDLLRGRTVTISQIGTTLPVSFSFAIAPFVFVFMHIYALARYDMLAANVRQFLAELRRTVPLEADRERCRQLLANVEFIQALVAQPGSRLYTPVWRWLVRGLIAVFPVFVLLLVQINALRYQSELITLAQQLVFLLDLSALVWFFYRAPLDGSAARRRSRMAEVKCWAKLLWLPAILIGLNLVYLNVVPADADVRLVRYEGKPVTSWTYLTVAFHQPLDVVLCPSLKWGCRYLRVDRRTLVDHVWDEKAMSNLRHGGADLVQLDAIEGLVLRDRFLRFAVLDECRLFGADLNGADLRAASFENAWLPGTKLSGSLLQGAQLKGARLEGVNLTNAQLQDAKLNNAQLQGANLNGAQLQGADLTEAQLEGVSLFSAQLQGAELNNAQLGGAFLVLAQLQNADLKRAQLRRAVLSNAQLQGADLTEAQLEGVVLVQAQLQGADLTRAKLQSADLRGSDLRSADLNNAQLQGADLSHAQLQGADLTDAQLQGAYLSEAKLWRASFTAETSLELSDLRAADLTTSLTDDQTKAMHATVDAIPKPRVTDAQKRFGQLLEGDQPPHELRFTASSERQVLVSDTKDPIFANIPAEWLISSPTPEYTSALVALLADELASSDADIAYRIAASAEGAIGPTGYDDLLRWRYVPVACRLLDNAQGKKIKLEQDLSGSLRDRKIECEPAKLTAPH